MIAVAGCVAQAEGAEIPRRAPGVDIVVGPQAYHNLPALVRRRRAGERALDTDMPRLSKFGALPARRRQGPSAFLTVQEGCDKFCTYCVVPYTRGAEISRPVRGDRRRGAGRWSTRARRRSPCSARTSTPGGEDGQGLDDLIRALDALAGPRAHPLHDQPPQRHDRGPDPRPCRGREADALSAPAGAVGQRPRAQGDEPQPQRATPISRIIDRVRAARPDIAISGDFIVGFPGETDAEFEATLSDRRGGELCAGFLVQIFAAPRHARGGDGRIRSRRR